MFKKKNRENAIMNQSTIQSENKHTRQDEKKTLYFQTLKTAL